MLPAANAIRIVLIVLGGVFVSPAAALEHSIEDLGRMLDIWRSSISSIEYRAEIEGRVVNTPHGVQRVSRRHFAAMHGYRCSETQHKIASMDWHEDPFWVRTLISPDRMDVLQIGQRINVGSNKFASLSSNPKLLDSYYDFYMLCIGWWPKASSSAMSASPEPNTSPIVLINSKEAVLRSVREKVSGHVCAVIEVHNPNGVSDVLWIAPSLSGALVQRHTTNLRSKFCRVINNSRFREAIAGVWLPMRVERIEHFGSTPNKLLGPDVGIISHANMKISEVQVNNLTEARFAPKFPSGTIFVNADDGTTKIDPGGRELLDSYIDTSSHIIDATTPVGNDALRFLIYGSCGALCGLACALLVGRRQS